MTKEQSSTLAEIIARIIPEFGKKIVKPVDQQKPALSPLFVNTLSCLEQGPVHTMSSLSKALNMSNQQLSAIVNQLEDKKYVVRTHSKTDRRVVNIAITKAGATALKKSNENYIQMLAANLSSIPEEDYEECLRILTDLDNLLKRINME